MSNRFTFVKPSDARVVVAVKRFFEWFIGLPQVCAKPILTAESQKWRSSLDHFGVSLKLEGIEHLRACDPNKPLLVVLNHPRGVMDGLCIGTLLDEELQGRGFKSISNSIVEKVFPPYKDFNIPVQNMSGNSSMANFSALKEAIRYLKQNNVLIIHPAGEVADFKLFSTEGCFKVVDGAWVNSYVQLFKRTGATVLPVHISGQNSWVYQLLSFFGASAKRMWNFREFLNIKDEEIIMTIKLPFEYSDKLNKMADGEVSNLVRKTVYSD